MRFSLIFAFIFFSLLVPLTHVYAQNPPDISSWQADGGLQTINYESSVAGKTYVIYLGTMQDFINPGQPTEHVRVVTRFIPFAVTWTQKSNHDGSIASAISNYTDAERDAILKDRNKNSDTIAYTFWNEATDARGRVVATQGTSYLLDTNGVWVHAPGKISMDPLSLQLMLKDKPGKKGKDIKANVTVGCVFSLGGAQQVLMIGPYDLGGYR